MSALAVAIAKAVVIILTQAELAHPLAVLPVTAGILWKIPVVEVVGVGVVGVGVGVVGVGVGVVGPMIGAVVGTASEAKVARHLLKSEVW